MNIVQDSAQYLIQNVESVLNQVSKQQTIDFLDCIETAERIFVYGSGRSGLIGQAFSMRLVHLGKQVNFVGDATTPPITAHDLLVVISNSGSTPSVKWIAEIAKSQHAQLVCITGNAHSPIGQLADFCVELSSKNNHNRLYGSLTQDEDESGIVVRFSRTPMNHYHPIMGTLFELSAMFYFDSLIPLLMHNMRETEESMKARHSNLE